MEGRTLVWVEKVSTAKKIIDVLLLRLTLILESSVIYSCLDSYLEGSNQLSVSLLSIYYSYWSLGTVESKLGRNSVSKSFFIFTLLQFGRRYGTHVESRLFLKNVARLKKELYMF